MSKQAFNPYLPLDVYIPDGEPHVFGDRVYVFGSHDKEHGNTYCMLPYVVYSAPVDDLTNWTAKGISYTGEGDPNVTEDHKYMYAPDVVQGNDGRYYLYYALGGYGGPISVAVCDTPDGQYVYHGDVRREDGSPLKRFIPFDPAVINDNGVIRLYYGAGYPFDDFKNFLTKGFVNKLNKMVLGKEPEEVAAEPDGIFGAVHVRLKDDMLTIAQEPVKITPSKTRGTQWAGHAFFEASSIRKVGDTYYFLYSSWNHHELCYATSSYPDREFTFRGTVISNGDIGIDGRKPKGRLNFTGNNHGGMECINGQWYIFYHRQTHEDSYNRQGCAEPITITKDGSIPQVEMTSCGLNPGPLQGQGTYPASICCNLTNGSMPHGKVDRKTEHCPCITSTDGQQYVSRISKGTKIGYKYFDLRKTRHIEFTCRGDYAGVIQICNGLHGKEIGTCQVADGQLTASQWQKLAGTIRSNAEQGAIFLKFPGTGTLEMLEFTLS